MRCNFVILLFCNSPFIAIVPCRRDVPHRVTVVLSVSQPASRYRKARPRNQRNGSIFRRNILLCVMHVVHAQPRNNGALIFFLKCSHWKRLICIWRSYNIYRIYIWTGQSIYSAFDVLNGISLLLFFFLYKLGAMR